VDIRRLKGGVFSRAYAFTSSDRAYVIRLSTFDHAAEGFAKDDYAAKHFAAPGLPIPRVVAIGSDADEYFAVGERVAGRVLEAMSPAERQPLLPGVLDALDAYLRADVGVSRGYGPWDAAGQGGATTWHEYLAAIIENDQDGFYRDWHALFRTSFLERDVYEMVYRHMLRLAAHCPDERALIHNDYHFENVLGESDRVTGVIDWANALYGDPLYEIARLSWWANWPGWWYDDSATFLRERYGAAPDYDMRIACYQCHIVLDDFRYYASAGKREEYEWARGLILAQIARQGSEM
jgi:hygromycin-B 4-O-kinase